MGSHFGVGEFTTHFRTDFSGWIGKFIGGMIWILAHTVDEIHFAPPKTPWSDGSPVNASQRYGFNHGFKVVREADFASIHSMKPCFAPPPMSRCVVWIWILTHRLLKPPNLQPPCVAWLRFARLRPFGQLPPGPGLRLWRPGPAERAAEVAAGDEMSRSFFFCGLGGVEASSSFCLGQKGNHQFWGVFFLGKRETISFWGLFFGGEGEPPLRLFFFFFLGPPVLVWEGGGGRCPCLEAYPCSCSFSGGGGAVPLF